MQESDPRREFIKKIPKAELHCHLEGSIPPELLLTLADRNGVTLPFSTPEAARSALQFDGLPEFIDFFTLAASVLRSADDFAAVVEHLARDAARQNIHHREVTFSYGYYDESVSWDDVLTGLVDGRAAAAKSSNVEIRFVAGVVRTADAETSSRVVERVSEAPEAAGIETIGMGGKERGFPAHRHRQTYQRAADLGFHRIAHAGETVGPSSVWDALCSLNVDRIDHGVRAIEDDILLDYLSTTQLPLTVCPISNVALDVYPNMDRHPVASLIEAGVQVSLHSDDPALFQADLLDNYEQVVTTFDLDFDDIEQLARASFEHSFLSAAERKRHLEELETESNRLRVALGP